MVAVGIKLRTSGTRGSLVRLEISGKILLEN